LHFFQLNRTIKTIMNIQTYYGKKLEVLEHADVRKGERGKVPQTTEIKKIYIIGICGTAMGSLAGLLKQAKYEVFGCDEGIYPPMSTMLDELGIEIDITPSSESLSDTAQEKVRHSDIVVVGNAIGPNHAVVTYARSAGKSLVSLPEALDLCVFQGRKRLVIAGTHGKTTTTGIVTSIFKEAARVGEIADPGYLIGGVMQGATTGFDLGKVSAGYFIIEGDEYDTAYFDKRPKFLTYGGDGGIVTSIELDHLDIYNDLEDYEQAFQFFIEGLPTSGHTLIAHHPDVARVAKKALQSRDGVDSSMDSLEKASHILTYGIEREELVADKGGSADVEENADVYLKNVVVTNGVQKGIFVYKGQELGEIRTRMSGRHNLMNVVGAAGLAYAYGISFDVIVRGIEQSSGMKRRQEVVHDGYATLIDDFAHHPTAVEETIAGIKKLYEGRRLIALFEPRSNTSRRKVFQDSYIAALRAADCVIIKQPLLRHNDNPENYIDATQMVRELSEKGVESYATDTPEQTLEVMQKIIKKEDVILTMSNGSFDGVRESLQKLLIS